MLETLNTLKFLFFDEESTGKIKQFAGINQLAFMIILSAIILSIPSRYTDIGGFVITFATSAILVAFALLLSFSVLYGIAVLLGSKEEIINYVFALSFSFLAINILSIAIAFILLNIGVYTQTYDLVIGVIQGGFVLFYLFVVFGNVAETAAGLKDFKGIALGLIAILVIYLFHIFLSMLP